jgi:hypothetical protein
MDTNADGRLKRHEFRKGYKKLCGDKIEDIDRIFDKIDFNKSG